jgi:predicted ATPase
MLRVCPFGTNLRHWRDPQGGGLKVPIPFVARAGVLAEIDSVLTAARAGRGALLTVTGEPGIGKTRLAEESAGRAGGFEVVWTWCPAAAGAAALRPWSRVLRILAGGHVAVARLIADSPFLAALADPARAGGGRDPEGARTQLSFDLAEVVAAAAALRPVLVVIDDAHQADVSSLRLLTELAPALRTMPAAVLVTARDGDRDWHGRLDMRTALLRSGDVVSLRPLVAGDIAAVVAGVTGAPAGPGLVRVIAERSAGNPFLVTELARQLAGPGIGQGADPAAARAIVPDSVRALAGARVGELTGTARDVVLAASVLGTRFRRDVLASLAGLEPGELAGALAAGRDAGLLELAEPGEDRFRHDLVRDAIYDSIPVDAREDLHVRAGDVLAGLAGRGRDVDDAEIAYHLVRAGTAAAGAAAEYARRAGDRALAALAFEDAVHWYERARRAGRPDLLARAAP